MDDNFKTQDCEKLCNLPRERMHDFGTNVSPQFEAQALTIEELKQLEDTQLPPFDIICVVLYQSIKEQKEDDALNGLYCLQKYLKLKNTFPVDNMFVNIAISLEIATIFINPEGILIEKYNLRYAAIETFKQMLYAQKEIMTEITIEHGIVEEMEKMIFQPELKPEPEIYYSILECFAVMIRSSSRNHSELVSCIPIANLIENMKNEEILQLYEECLPYYTQILKSFVVYDLQEDILEPIFYTLVELLFSQHSTCYNYALKALCWVFKKPKIIWEHLYETSNFQDSVHIFMTAKDHLLKYDLIVIILLIFRNHYYIPYLEVRPIIELLHFDEQAEESNNVPRLKEFAAKCILAMIGYPHINNDKSNPCYVDKFVEEGLIEALSDSFESSQYEAKTAISAILCFMANNCIEAYQRKLIERHAIIAFVEMASFGSLDIVSSAITALYKLFVVGQKNMMFEACYKDFTDANGELILEDILVNQGDVPEYKIICSGILKIKNLIIGSDEEPEEEKPISLYLF